jgi:hypothetical protein
LFLLAHDFLFSSRLAISFLTFTVLYEVRIDKFHQPQNFNLRPSTKQDS